MKYFLIVVAILISVILIVALFWFFFVYDVNRDLVAAAGDNDVKKINLLIVKDKKYINSIALDGWTALTIASCKGHEEIVELLLQNGADVDFTADKTALFWATYYGHLRIIELLKMYNAKPLSQSEIEYIEITRQSRKEDIGGAVK